MSWSRAWLSVFICAWLGASRTHAQANLEHVFRAPEGSLIKGVTVADDGSVYVVLEAGGANNLGAVVRYTADGQASVLHSFASAQGAQPMAALTFGSDGELYGTATSGGMNNYGTVYRLTRAGELSVVHDFTDFDGGSSHAPLLLADDGNLWGVTYGLYNVDCGDTLEPYCSWELLHSGRAFKLAADGTLQVVASGLIYPSGGLMQASSGNIYGVEPRVAGFGYHEPDVSSGQVYEIDPRGVVTLGSGVHRFDFNPGSELVEGADGNLYGVSDNSGYSLGPSVFRLSTDYVNGTVQQYFDISYDGVSSGGLAVGSDGNLYGAGTNSYFRVTPAGVTTHIRAYDGDIAQPTAALRAAGSSNFVLGSGDNLIRLTQSGAASVLRRFGFHDGDVLNGLVIARDRSLYGTTRKGGRFGSGTVFQLSAQGLRVLYDFATRGDYPPEPLRSPLVAAEDGSLYAVTSTDPAQLLRIDPNAQATILHTFSISSGPQALMLGDDGALYGGEYLLSQSEPRTWLRGIYRFDPESAVYRSLATAEYILPLLAANGQIYGLDIVAGADAATRQTGLFRMAADGTGTRTHVHVFDSGPNGQYPSSYLAAGPDGSIYMLAHGNDEGATELLRWTTDDELEVFFRYGPDNAPGQYYTPAITVAQSGEVCLTQAGSWPNGGAVTTVITPDRQWQQVTAQSLDTVSGPDHTLYRIAPLHSGAYNGFRIEPLLGGRHD